MNRIVGTITDRGQHLIAMVSDREAYRPANCQGCGRAAGLMLIGFGLRLAL
jgi:hypothetical protein